MSRNVFHLLNEDDAMTLRPFCLSLSCAQSLSEQFCKTTDCHVPDSAVRPRIYHVPHNSRNDLCPDISEIKAPHPSARHPLTRKGYENNSLGVDILKIRGFLPSFRISGKELFFKELRVKLVGQRFASANHFDSTQILSHSGLKNANAKRRVC